MGSSRVMRPASNSGSTWYQDDEALLAVARRHRAAGAPPAIAGYDGLREIKRGGQGVVFEAVQRSTRRKVAIKALLAGALASDVQRRRFEREAELAASLRHPNIVRVYDSGVTAEGYAYLVMEFIEGTSLDEWLARVPAPDLKAKVALFTNVADAVSHAHQAGVIHRDLKPSNVRVDASDEPKVLDFGLAKSVGGAETLEVSRTGQFLGSLPWASPEQADGAVLDVRSDVYSLGVMLYQLITGAFPYDVTGSLTRVLENIRTSAPAVPRDTAPGVDDDLRTIALKCLAKEPDRRYQSAAELRDDLRAWQGDEPIRARRDSTWYALRRAARRHRAAAVASGAIAAVAVLASVFMGVSFARARAAQRAAHAQAEQRAATISFLEDMLGTPDPNVDGRQIKVVDVLGRAARRLDADAALDPGVRSALHDSLAVTYIGLSEYQLAEPHVLAARDERLARLGPTTAETVSSQSRLAYLRLRQGKLDEAEQLASENAALAVDHLPPGAPDRIAGEGVFGLVLLERGKYDQAEPVLRGVLAQRPLSPPGGRTNWADIISNLGLTLRRMSRLDEAETLYREQLLDAESRMGPKNGTTLALLNNLGALLAERGKLDEADAIYTRVLAAREETDGPDADETLTALNNIGMNFLDRRNFAQADRVFHDLLERSRRARGPEHPATLVVMNNLARLLQDEKKLDEAEAMMKETLGLREKVMGPEHPDTLITASNLSVLFAIRDRVDEAIPLSRRVLDTRLRTMGEKRFDTIISMNNLGKQLHKAGRPDEALPLLERATVLAAEVMGEKHWAVGAFAGNLGRCLIALTREDDGERELLKAYAILKAALGEGDPRTAQNAQSLADLYRSRGQEAKAREFAGGAK